jgi:gamma-glutamyl:cysteine ligase YbdK (ATP-grasp superfamily)
LTPTPSKGPPFHLFSVFGIEIEYPIVDTTKGSIRPLVAGLLERAAGKPTADFVDGPISWSNELVDHVVEFKATQPEGNFEGLAKRFHASILKAFTHLRRFDAALCPGGMHPLMNPERETVLWKGEYAEVYAAFDKLFNCHRHGWANVQSCHLNLPFSDGGEFGRLMAACRLILPLTPALCAASPFEQGRTTGFLDTRLVHYASNAASLPAMSGEVIPEPVFDPQRYRSEILAPISTGLRRLGAADALLGNEWLNARGAIARFDRGSIELRLADTQERPAADLALACAHLCAVRALVEERYVSIASLASVPQKPLVELLQRTIKSGPAAALGNSGLGAVFGAASAQTAGELWRSIAERTFAGPPELGQALEVVLKHGTLAERMLRWAGPQPSVSRIVELIHELTRCLKSDVAFGL